MDRKSYKEKLKRWRGIRESLIGALKAEPSEFFVNRVMAEVGSQAAPVRKPAPLLRVPGWLYPELGLAAAALAIFLLGSAQKAPVSADALLLSRVPQEDRWIGMAEEA